MRPFILLFRRHLEDVSFRPARRQDLPHILRLLAADAIGTTKYEECDQSQDLLLAFDDIDRDPNNHIVVGELEGCVVATLQLTFIRNLSGRRAQLEAVRVDESLRGRGIGAKLLGFAIAWARREGCNMVQLTANSARHEAIRFYQRLGFVASHTGMKLELKAQS